MILSKMHAIGFPLLCSFGAILVVTGGSPVTAQAGNGNDQSPNVCMVRASSGEGRPATRVIVPRAGLGFLAAKGFEEFDCGTGGFGAAKQLEFRDFVCRIASEETKDMQDQFEAILGARPATLCGMTEVVLGSWQRSEGVQQ